MTLIQFASQTRKECASMPLCSGDITLGLVLRSGRTWAGLIDIGYDHGHLLTHLAVTRPSWCHRQRVLPDAKERFEDTCGVGDLRCGDDLSCQAWRSTWRSFAGSRTGRSSACSGKGRTPPLPEAGHLLPASNATRAGDPVSSSPKRPSRSRLKLRPHRRRAWRGRRPASPGPRARQAPRPPPHPPSRFKRLWR